MIGTIDPFNLRCPRFSRTTVGLRAFSISGPKVWNQLPIKLRKNSSIDSFKKDLKTHYFNIYLRWHCFGQYLCYYYCCLVFYLHFIMCRTQTLCPVKDTSPCRFLLFEVPSFSRTTVGLRAFSISGPKVWNLLPIKLRKTSLIDSFKKDLTTHYFNLYLRWHCFGLYLC